MPSFMFRCLVILAFMVVCVSCSSTTAPQSAQFIPTLPPRANELPVAAFASLPDVEKLSLSPNGKYLAYLKNQNNDTLLVIQNRTGDLSASAIFKSPNDNFKIKSYQWANDDRLLINIMYFERIAGMDINRTVLLAINRDGTQLNSDMVGTNKRDKERLIPQFQDYFALIPNDPQHIAISLADVDHGLPRVYKMDVNSGDRETIESNPGYVREWIFDLQGNPKLGIGTDHTKNLVVFRDNNQNWKTLFESEVTSPNYLEPLGFDANPDILYAHINYKGRKAIARIFLSKGISKAELVVADPKFDITGKLLHSAGHDSVVGVEYITDRIHRKYWNEPAEKLQTIVNKALPSKNNYIISSTGKIHIIYSVNADAVPAYYSLDEDGYKMGKIADAYPLLQASHLTTPQTVSIQTRDGIKLDAYLTKPKTAGTTPGPTIIFPHGGPWSRDLAGFNLWTAFMADRGWTVLQINFRGSEGYGNDFTEAGFKRWGLEMQDDITDGVQWLIQQKIADPQKVCIVGASYGGYAALMGIIKTPELYRCAVSLAPVTDLIKLIDHMSDYRYIDSDIRAAIADKRIGNWWDDKDRLKQTSPLEQAARIHTPLLLAHGTSDINVNVEHSRELTDALRNVGFKDFKYIEMDKADHYLSRQVDRMRFFSEMDEFLRRFQ